VTSAPVITVEPQPQTTCVGSTAQFTVVATGTAPLTYVWRKNGTAIPGAPNQPSFTTPAAVQGDNGAQFSVIVSNNFGSDTSANAALTVNSSPTVSNPTPVIVCAGLPANFQVTGGGGGHTFQWLRNGNPISGANSNSFTIPSTVPGDNGATFACRVTNNCGQATSQSALLTVRTAPSITSHPQTPVFVVVGASGFFSVAASGTAPLSFQWHRNGVIIPGATSSSFQTPAAVLGDDGARFSCVVSNPCGSATSNDGILEVAKRWSTIWAASISAKCGSCHGSPGSAGLTLSVSASDSHANTVNAATNTSNTCLPGTRILPLQPNNSAFVRVITTVPSCISQNHSQITSRLTSTEIQEIVDCILAGIPNN
jgi:hypothetical protein